MNSEEKKVYLLLKSIIFQFHGFDDQEQEILQTSAEKLEALEELSWVQDFISEDIYSAFDRAREYFHSSEVSRERRISFLSDVWQANNQKGYITEMEAMGMLKVARDWQAEGELMERVRNPTV